MSMTSTSGGIIDDDIMTISSTLSRCRRSTVMEFCCAPGHSRLGTQGHTQPAIHEEGHPMSVFHAPFRTPPTSKSEDEEVSEAVPPPIDVAAPSMPGVIVEYDVVSGTAVTLPPQPIENPPIPAASAPCLHSPQHHPQRPNLLESARLEREIARNASELRAVESEFSNVDHFCAGDDVDSTLVRPGSRRRVANGRPVGASIPRLPFRLRSMGIPNQ